MAYDKSRTAHIRDLSYQFEAQWDICEENKTEQAAADAALNTANQELQKAAQMYSPSSPEYKAAAEKQASAQAARDAQYNESAADNAKLDSLQQQLIDSSKYLRG